MKIKTSKITTAATIQNKKRKKYSAIWKDFEAVRILLAHYLFPTNQTKQNYFVGSIYSLFFLLRVTALAVPFLT